MKTLKKLTEINRNAELIPVFQDEVHFQAQTTITRVWAKKGSDPKVMSKPGKNKIAYSGFIISETGELVVTKPDWFNYKSVIESLRAFSQAKPAPAGKKYCMILDNAPWHRKAVRLVWSEQLEEYADIREKMECLPLPPYSPDLNPIEQVWRKTRKEKTHNRYFNNLAKLIDTLDYYFAGFFAPNESLRSLCSFNCFV